MNLTLISSTFLLLSTLKVFPSQIRYIKILLELLVIYLLTCLFVNLNLEESYLVFFLSLILFLTLIYLIKEEFYKVNDKLMGNFEITFFIFLCLLSFFLILYCNNIYWSVFTLEIQSFLIFGSCALLKSNNLLKVVEGSLSYIIPGFFSFFLMLASIYLMEICGKDYIPGNFLLLIAIMIKMGLIPFGLWVNNVVKNLSFNSIILLTFINKLSILLILVMYFSHLWYILTLCGLASLLFGSVLMVNTPKTKEMLAYSSIINSGWLCLLMVASSNLTIDLESNQTILGLFYLIYILGILIFIDTNKKKSPFLKDLNNNTLVKKINITNNSLTYAGLLSMSGMPPFTGFIVKYLILLQVINLFSMNIATIIVSFSIIATFCYIRPIISFSTPEVFKSLKFLGDKRLQNKIDGLPFHDLILISFSVILLSTIIFIFT